MSRPSRRSPSPASPSWRRATASSSTPLPAEQRPAALAAALSDDGYAAGTSELGTGVQLCQHHCPVQHVAEQFPQLCDAETAAIGRLLGVHVQRLATIAHGDGVCTTSIPLPSPAPDGAGSTDGNTTHGTTASGTTEHDASTSTGKAPA